MRFELLKPQSPTPTDKLPPKIVTPTPARPHVLIVLLLMRLWEPFYFKPQLEYGELNPGPWEEQSVLLTSKLSL